MIKIGRITLGVTVILIGVIWIVSITNPGLANQLSVYWPIVFIFYGLEVIISSFFHSDKKLSIGLLILSIILAFSASNLIENRRFDWQFIWTVDGIFENGITEQVEIVQPIGEAKNVQVTVPNGRIEVLLSDDENLHFIGNAIWQKNKTVPTVIFEREGDQWQLTDDKLIGLNGKLFLPKTITQFNFESSNGSVKIEPELVNLLIQAKTMNGVLEINGGKQVSSETVNGDIRIAGVERVSAKTVNGEISVSHSLLSQLDLETEQGSITIDTNEVIAATIRSVSGEIELRTNQTSYRIQAQTVSGEIELFNQVYGNNIVVVENNPVASILLETTNGDIEVNYKGE
ncbi:MAG: DUF4097 family beta strand repeat-containing protein [Culicoidibacterales bacterium]